VIGRMVVVEEEVGEGGRGGSGSGGQNGAWLGSSETEDGWMGAFP
jgi:hypothetical protein